jgi:tight adherence protein B
MIGTVLGAFIIGAGGALAYQLLREGFAARGLHRRARQQVGLVPPDDPRQGTFASVVLTSPYTVAATVGLFGIAFAGPVGVSAGVVPIVVTRSRRTREQRRRSQELADQLAPTLQLMVGHLRIGGNVLSALSEVSESTSDPLKSILQEVVAEARLGSPVEDVLQAVAERESDRHLNIVASAIGLHARHGGSLVEILDSVTETIEEEDRLRRDIRSATADGRLSATVLLAMPPVSLALVSLLSPDYARPLVTEPLGRAMSVTAVVLGVTGWRWLRVLSNPRVVA